MTIDPYKLALLPRKEPLHIYDDSRPFTCAICGVVRNAHDWRVTLPDDAGRACPGCANDAGFRVE